MDSVMAPESDSATERENNAPIPSATASIRATKRKFDDALQTLDNAVGVSDGSRPPPAKKPHTSRSLYATLAKYGIRSKPSKTKLSATAKRPEGLTKPTPHLSAILARAASRTRDAFPSFKFTFQAPFPSSPSVVLSTASTSSSKTDSSIEYRPSSLPSFLSRLETFKLATYANKPDAIDAVAAAKCGWTNDGKDRLVCGVCGASWVVVGREGMTKEAANVLVDKQKGSLIEAHKNGCPWKSRQCDPSIYCVPLKSSATMARELKAKALALGPLLEKVEIKHPLTVNQLRSLKGSLAAIDSQPTVTAFFDGDEDTEVSSRQPEPLAQLEPSETSILAALFGWGFPPPQPPPSLSRATSLAPPSRPATPSASFSRSSSVLSRGASPAPAPTSVSTVSTMASSVSTAAAMATPRRTAPRLSYSRAPSERALKNDGSLLYCSLCQRRIGLWAFVTQARSTVPLPTSPRSTAAGASVVGKTVVTSPTRTRSIPQQRQFDILKEHRSYCPYVVRSTVVPSLPTSASTTNLGQKPSLARASTSTGTKSSPTTPTKSTSKPALGLTRTPSVLTRANSSVGVHSSGTVPGLPGQTGAVEGWRAVLTVLLRYGLGLKQQRALMRLNFVERHRGLSNPAGDESVAGETGDGEDGEEGVQVNEVEAMVAGVKSRGGNELLRYVKGLLG